MYFPSASLMVFAAMIGRLSAEDLESEDVPTACTTICQPIVNLTSTCEVRNEIENDKSNDAIEAACICNNKSFNVAAVGALCASCIAQNGANTNDMAKIMSTCSFSSTSYAASATSLVAAITVSATRPTAMGSTTSGSGSQLSSANSNIDISKDIRTFVYVAAAGIVLGLGWEIV